MRPRRTSVRDSPRSLLRDSESGARSTSAASTPFAESAARLAGTLGPMSDTSVHSRRAPEPVGPYPHARRAGEFLFVSGIGPRRRGTNEIPGVSLDGEGRVIAHDIEAQCRSCFDNVRSVLDDAGVEWDRIVDVTAFLTHLSSDFAHYNRVYAEYFAGPGNPNPARTTVEVTALPTPIAVEVKVVAWLGSR